jgi:adenosylmethionine-8-amino-7-oxononanoate aminotransferase
MAPGALLVEDDRAPTQSQSEKSSLAPPATNSIMHEPWNALLHRDIRSTPLTLLGAKGNWLRVSDGIKTWMVLDGSGGAAVSNIGHGDFRVMQAEIDYFKSTGISYASSSSFRTEVADEFGQMLLESTNHEMARVVFYGSGI